MLNSCLIAFAMYSKIPMPRVAWNEKSKKYVLCFFPLVGAVIGGLSIGIYYGLKMLHAGDLVRAGLLTVLPLLVSGGIHMDGFLDTMDAKHSYLSKEKKLEILKDPHAGAFAIICCMGYAILHVALFSEITSDQIVFVAIGYVYSRALSGLAAMTFQKANPTGSLADFVDAAEKNKKIVVLTLLLWAVICVGTMIALHPAYGIVCSIVGLASLYYYKRMAYRIFGGVTGDLAGYFLQICELALLGGLVLTSYLLRIL